MRTEDEIRADASLKSPFSNRTEYDIWADDHCYECQNDRAEEEVFCPILGVAMLHGVTPKEWTRREQEWQIGEKSGTYEVIDECTEFVQRTHFSGDPEEPADPDVEFGRRIETVHIPLLDGQIDMFGGGS